MALPMMIRDGLQDRTNLLEAYGYMEIVESYGISHRARVP